MKEWEVIFSDIAEAELDDIDFYISSVLLEPKTAEKQVFRILDNVQSLKNMPERYPLYKIEPWRSRGVRTLTVDNYVVFYHTVSATGEVFIDHIFYGGRDIERLM